ncbi:hypothetical protein ON010_g11865 [Phytophthora cinnamomi]|nr:hypothetical protein ON010_g11865 [Phytophthora cinnamomi]
MAALAPFEFSINDHDFRVIAADSEPLQPSDPINTLLINAGQRYIIVQAKNAGDYSSSPTDSFWMRARALSGLPWTAGSVATAELGFNDEALAIVHYKDEEGPEPTTTVCEDKTTVGEFDFMPLAPAGLPAVTTDRAVLEFNLSSPATSGAHGAAPFHDRQRLVHCGPTGISERPRYRVRQAHRGGARERHERAAPVPHAHARALGRGQRHGVHQGRPQWQPTPAQAAGRHDARRLHRAAVHHGRQR